MVFENVLVKHKSFGEGIVTAHVGNYITVKFGETEKKFVYPDSFERFLTLADGTVSDDILNDIRISKDKKQLIIDKKNEENLRAMTKGIVIPGKEASAETDEEEQSNKESEEL